MKLVVFLVFCIKLGALGLSLSSRDFECPDSSGATTTSRLKSTILCDYDSSLRPVRDHQNSTLVQFRLILKFFEYDPFTHTLSVDAWLNVFWKDQHLVWKPDDYDGITSLHLSTYDIWLPDLSIYNRKDQGTDPYAIQSTTNCQVSSNGVVVCIPPIHTDALCVADLRRYPFDEQTCTLRFGSWLHKGEEIDIKPMTEVVDTDDLLNNGEWDLVSTKGIRHRGNYSCCPNVTYPSVDIIFKIKRHSTSHAASMVLPLLGCMILTITSIMMSPLNKDRLILCIVTFIVESMLIQHVSYMVPLHGENIPNIILFARDSMILGAINILATIFFKYMMESKRDVPVWINGMVTALTSTRPGQIIFLQDGSLKGAAEIQNKEDAATIIPEAVSNSTTDAWWVVGKFLDVLFCISYCIVFFVMIVKF